MENLLVIY